jgi:hypothetical protein
MQIEGCVTGGTTCLADQALDTTKITVSRKSMERIGDCKWAV